MKPVVIYYSRTGNNRFVALRLAEALGCPAEELKPRARSYAALLASSFLGIGGRTKKLQAELADCDRVVLCGPLWMGRLAAPARHFLLHDGKAIKRIDLVSCCGSGDERKSDRFGYETAFAMARKRAGPRLVETCALPIGLAVEGSPKDSAAVMAARLSEATFTGEIRKRFDELVARLNEKTAPR
jgi:hypothetical protein